MEPPAVPRRKDASAQADEAWKRSGLGRNRGARARRAGSTATERRAGDEHAGPRHARNGKRLVAIRKLPLLEHDGKIHAPLSLIGDRTSAQLPASNAAWQAPDKLRCLLRTRRGRDSKIVAEGQTDTPRPCVNVYLLASAKVWKWRNGGG